ncbi:cytosolic protein [Aliihoeflea aestuarii]|jgi:steroid delta-isomerase-like uncharacterized protein|uniref:ketosteroid isomerase-related protein n=1 Tax=Aliihoeflea aestuarii TaxID=453840 RepID=UPI002094CBD8|nr:ketosteroid isomerase-related protein [Aliihoeflea aestuarii]MCO6393097.1 cytosolic protein [Aliihoeflea aestuarii]
MSQTETKVLIERYVDAFNNGDNQAMLDCLGEDVAHDVNEGEREIGKEKFKWFLAMMDKHYKEQLTDIVIMTNETGSRAAAEFTVHGEYLATAEGLPEANGQRYSVPGAILFEIDGGRISRVTTYYNLKNWIDSVSKG